MMGSGLAFEPFRDALARSIVFALATVAAICWPGTASGHEIGKTQVSAILDRDGGYRIDMVVDPDALLTRLEVLDGRMPSPPGTRVDADRVAALESTLLEHVDVWFGDTRVTPAVSYAEPVEGSGPARPLGGIVSLTGRLPESPTTFRFGTSLVYGSYALTIQRTNTSAPTTVWLNGGETSEPLELSPSSAVPSTTAAVVRQYVSLGYSHILPKGLDHILFVVGLFLLSPSLRPLLAQVTAFTVAHSITLGLTMLGVIGLPSSVVEPLIALSIAYVAIENIAVTTLSAWRIVLVFGFGLLHGMGFAGVLGELGMPKGEFVTALLSFNAGVELGQLSVIAMAAAAVAYWRARTAAYRRWVVQPASAIIAAIGLYWTVERLLG